MYVTTRCIFLALLLLGTVKGEPMSVWDWMFSQQYNSGGNQNKASADANRQTRQTNYNAPQGQLIDSIFQIPIQTLNSVSSLVKNAAGLPVFQRRRNRNQELASPVTSSRGSRGLTHAAQIARLPQFEDGSSYKI